jgi:hypothetical protein
MLVGTQLPRRCHDGRHEQIIEIVGGLHLVGEEREELFEFANPQRVEQHVLATGEESVQRGAGDTALGGDVVDRDLGEPPALAARLGRVEDPPLQVSRRQLP